MTKNILSLAVAAALTAGAGIAQAQDITIYGHMHYSTDYVSASSRNSAGPLGDREDWQTGVNRNSRFGIKGSEDLGNGLKAIFQIESQVFDSVNGGGQVGNRNTYVGLSGDWGTALMGRHDTPYKIATGSLDLFADTIADYNNNIGSFYGLRNSFDTRAQQTLAYISPNMNGLTIAGAVVDVTLDESALPLLPPGDRYRDTMAVSLAAMYANGPLFASLAYEGYQGALARSQSGVRTNRNIDSWKLGLGYKANDFTVGLVYEDIEASRVAGVRASQENWMLNASYAFGNNVLKAQYGNSNPRGTRNSYENFSLGLDHNLSKRTSLYAIYSNMSNARGTVLTPGGQGSLYCANSAFGDQCGTGPSAGSRNIDAISFGMQHKF